MMGSGSANVRMMSLQVQLLHLLRATVTTDTFTSIDSIYLSTLALPDWS